MKCLSCPNKGFTFKLFVLYSLRVTPVCNFLALNRNCVRVWMYVRAPVCWPSMCACWFICHMPRALWNRGTIIHSSGLQHQCLPVSLIYSLIYTSDTSAPSSQNPCWHKTGSRTINLQMLPCRRVPLVSVLAFSKATVLNWCKKSMKGRQMKVVACKFVKQKWQFKTFGI